jgi:folate-dependent phosphoribosylglycinamide formyltransferase PurN
MSPSERPSAVLLCHEADRIDAEGLAAWLAASFRLAGVVALRERPGPLQTRARREIRRSGWLRFLDVLAFRAYYRLRLARADAQWIEAELARLRARYPARLDGVPRLSATNPNDAEVRGFLREIGPDLVIARCKFILKPEIFEIPRAGTFVLHPGICPEYRNAHGCFWALARRDLERVGMTLLRVDAGVDTGPVLFQGGGRFDEAADSHVVIQHRVVLDNLDAIAERLLAACRGEARPIPTAGRSSATWGQPWLSAYVRWKRAARRRRSSASTPPVAAPAAKRAE